MAGTCEQAIPATILAIVELLALRRVRIGIALRAAPSRHHHFRVGFLGHARHHARHVLKREAIAKRDFDRVVDIAADFQHAQPIALEHRAPLLGREREPIEIRGLIVLEALAVLRLVERHAEHVQVVADAPAVGVVDVGSGYVVVVMRLSHVVSKALDLSAAGVVARISCRTMSRITSIALRISGLFGRCAEVARDSGDLSTGRAIGVASAASAHWVALTAFIGSTPNPWPCRTRSITAGMHSISYATRILRSTPASAFSTDMRMACGRLGMISG